MSKSFRGCYTVTITPFTADGARICTESLKRFLDWQLACNVPGVIILGTTGEFLTISDDERREYVGTTIGVRLDDPYHVRAAADLLIRLTGKDDPKR